MGIRQKQPQGYMLISNRAHEGRRGMSSMVIYRDENGMVRVYKNGRLVNYIPQKLLKIMNDIQKALGREPIPCTCDKALRSDGFVDCDGGCETEGGE